MWDINLRKKGFYKYLMPNGCLKFACLLHFSGVQQKLFTHFTEVKHISVLCIGQKPPVVSVRWDLIERSGGFSAWFVLLGSKEPYLHVEGIKVPVWLLNKPVCRAGTTFPIPASPTALSPPALRLLRGFCWQGGKGEALEKVNMGMK